jgi:hypothetical protein
MNFLVRFYLLIQKQVIASDISLVGGRIIYTFTIHFFYMFCGFTYIV